MKKTGYLLFHLFIISMLFSSMASFNNNISSEIAEAIRKGNSQHLAQYFGSNVDIVIPGNDDTYSKTQAELILRNFFSENEPGSFTINHEGSSQDDLMYIIGTLKTTGNKSYRTYFLIKKIEDNYFVHQLQFERQ